QLVVLAAGFVQVGGAFFRRALVQGGEEDGLHDGQVAHGRAPRGIAPGDSATKVPRAPQRRDAFFTRRAAPLPPTAPRTARSERRSSSARRWPGRSPKPGPPRAWSGRRRSAA